MRQFAVVLLACLATGWTGSPSTAQTPAAQTSAAPSAVPLTEDEFLGPLLADDSPAVLQLRGELGSRRADVGLARLVEAPEISGVRESVGGETETEAAIAWRPPRPDRRRLDVRRAEERLAAAESSLAELRLELRLELRRSYAGWATAAERVEILETEASLLRELTRRSEERSQRGEASGLETRRLRLAGLEVATRVALARAELSAALGAIHAWRPDLAADDSAARLDPALPDLPMAPSDVPTPPAVAALEAELRAAELEAQLAGKVAEMPQLTLGWKQVDPGDVSLPSDDGAVFGLSWPIPLSGEGRAKRLRAETHRDALAAQLLLLHQRLDAERRSARDAYDQLRRSSAEATDALADVEPAIHAARTAFQLGEGDLTTLLDTVRTVVNARLAALDLHSAALARQRELERVLGLPFATTTPDFSRPTP